MIIQKLEVKRKQILRRARSLVAPLEANSHFWFLVARVQLSKIDGEKKKTGYRRFNKKT